eukprot:4419474-Pyramimonas_sp.AAC.1
MMRLGGGQPKYRPVEPVRKGRKTSTSHEREHLTMRLEHEMDIAMDKISAQARESEKDREFHRELADRAHAQRLEQTKAVMDGAAHIAGVIAPHCKQQ